MRVYFLERGLSYLVHHALHVPLKHLEAEDYVAAARLRLRLSCPLYRELQDLQLNSMRDIVIVKLSEQHHVRPRHRRLHEERQRSDPLDLTAGSLRVYAELLVDRVPAPVPLSLRAPRLTLRVRERISTQCQCS